MTSQHLQGDSFGVIWISTDHLCIYTWHDYIGLIKAERFCCYGQRMLHGENMLNDENILQSFIFVDHKIETF